jgi:hypothetical protein
MAGGGCKNYSFPRLIRCLAARVASALTFAPETDEELLIRQTFPMLIQHIHSCASRLESVSSVRKQNSDARSKVRITQPEINHPKSPQPILPFLDVLFSNTGSRPSVPAKNFSNFRQYLQTKFETHLELRLDEIYHCLIATY